MKAAKNDRIYVRVSKEIKADFETVAAYRGLKTSALLHSLIVKTIHEQRELTSQIFKTIIPAENLPEESKGTRKTPQSENKRADSKTKKTVKTINVGSGKIPLIDEAESAANEREDE